MDGDTMSFGFSRSYPSRRKSHLELFIDFEEVKGDDELRTIYPCPYCADDFDLLELCCHIDLDHPLDSKSGICPVCAVWVATNILEHIKAQHGNIIKSQLKHYKHESYPTLSFSTKDIEDGHWQSSSAGLSPTVSASNTASDPFLSFLYGGAASAESQSVQPDSSSEESIEEMHASDTVLERDVQPSLSDKDQSERARRSGFVQELLMSTILDPDF